MAFPRVTLRFVLGLAFLAMISPTCEAAVRQDTYERAGRLVDNQRYAEAIVLYQELLVSSEPLDNSLKSRILNNIGFCDFKLNRYKESAEFYRRALQIDQDYAVCLNNLAALLMNQKRWEEAIPYLQRATAVDKSAKVVFNLFVVHYSLKHRDEALANLQEALSLDTSYTEARLKAKGIDQRDIDKLRKMKGKLQ